MAGRVARWQGARPRNRQHFAHYHYADRCGNGAIKRFVKSDQLLTLAVVPQRSAARRQLLV